MVTPSFLEGSDDERQSKQNPPQVQFLTPFGAHDPDKLKMIGSFQFPSLRFGKNMLPLQQDSYSCGIAITTTTAILCRDLFGQIDTTSDVFNDSFSSKGIPVLNCDRAGEYYAHFPESVIHPLPNVSKDGLPILQAIKAQWFLLFDCLAVVQHKFLPKRANLESKYWERLEADYKQHCTTWPGIHDDVLNPLEMEMFVPLNEILIVKPKEKAKPKKKKTKQKTPEELVEAARLLDTASPVFVMILIGCKACQENVMEYLAFDPCVVGQEMVDNTIDSKFLTTDMVILGLMGIYHKVLDHHAGIRLLLLLIGRKDMLKQ